MRSKQSAFLLATLAVAGSLAPVGTAGAEPTDPVQPSPPPAPAAPATVIDHDGLYAVGTDIVPGAYASAGPVEGGACYWKRVGGADGTQIVDNAISKKPQVVLIDAGDKAFKTSGCQPWQQTDAAPTNAAQGLLPALVGGAKLRLYLDDVNRRAAQSGQGQLPPP